MFEVSGPGPVLGPTSGFNLYNYSVRERKDKGWTVAYLILVAITFIGGLAAFGRMYVGRTCAVCSVLSR